MLNPENKTVREVTSQLDAIHHGPSCNLTVNEIQPRDISFNMLPSGATSSMVKGIFPTAWVEQLRHGSKARMPCSTRLRMPSLMLSPLMYCFAMLVMVLFIAILL
jgi:hypothetical protein